MSTKVYVASRVHHADMWKALRDNKSKPIISTWIDEAGEGETDDMAELWTRIETEIKSADRLIFYANANDFPLKGALVEVGMALSAGIPVYVTLGSGVVLDGKNLRPLGSWALHPLVRFAHNIQLAFTMK